MLEPLAEIKNRIEAAFPEAAIELVLNEAVPSQSSLRVDPAHARVVAGWLRDDPSTRLDYASNVTGVDWLDRVETQHHRIRRVVDGQEREYEEVTERLHPGFLEVVYHLYSMELKHGPLILRLRTADRAAPAALPSLTPVWRSCEFQEREVYDLFGIAFEGHPDLRRILMWDEFEDFPMRKDYVSPDDFEYEPTPHDEVLGRAQAHYPPTESA